MDFFTGTKYLLKRVTHKKSLKLFYLMKWDRFFEGLCLLFFPNVPGATFIQGATLIPESRVVNVSFLDIFCTPLSPFWEDVFYGWSRTCLENKGPLKVLSGTKLMIMGSNLNSFKISLQSCH